MPSFCLRQWAQAHQHHCIHNSHQQFICLAIRKTPSPSGGYCGEFLFLLPKLCQPASMFCHALGINVGSFCPFGLRRHASFLQGIADLEPCTLLLYSFAHFFIPPPGFRFLLVVLGETTNFDGSIQKVALHLWPAAATAVIVFALKADRLAVVGSLSFQVRMRV